MRAADGRAARPALAARAARGALPRGGSIQRAAQNVPRRTFSVRAHNAHGDERKEGELAARDRSDAEETGEKIIVARGGGATERSNGAQREGAGERGEQW